MWCCDVSFSSNCSTETLILELCDCVVSYDLSTIMTSRCYMSGTTGVNILFVNHEDAVFTSVTATRMVFRRLLCGVSSWTIFVFLQFPISQRCSVFSITGTESEIYRLSVQHVWFEKPVRSKTRGRYSYGCCLPFLGGVLCIFGNWD